MLIVDDDDASRNAMQTLLELDGFRVVTAADGLEGIEHLHGGLRPMAILLDICMPRMDGFQFRSVQVGDPSFADIPVVVYSAQIQASENIATLQPAAYLEKPFDIEEFRRIFARLRGDWSHSPQL